MARSKTADAELSKMRAIVGLGEPHELSDDEARKLRYLQGILEKTENAVRDYNLVAGQLPFSLPLISLIDFGRTWRAIDAAWDSHKRARRLAKRAA